MEIRDVIVTHVIGPILLLLLVAGFASECVDNLASLCRRKRPSAEAVDDRGGQARRPRFADAEGPQIRDVPDADLGVGVAESNRTTGARVAERLRPHHRHRAGRHARTRATCRRSDRAGMLSSGGSPCIRVLSVWTSIALSTVRASSSRTPVDDREAGLVREQPVHRDLILAVGTKLRPVLDYRGVQIQRTALDQ
jgi:hypothetical protein